jgi:Protein of unknown function (DUF1638)
MELGRVKIIACATVIEEMLPHLPPEVQTLTLDFGLHLRPDGLRKSLQEAIDATAGTADTIVLGYGLCSQAVVGLHATAATLVVPCVDDCISIFLGSRTAYQQQARKAPGTYYLTKGWIEVGDSPFEEHKKLVVRYGQQRADRMSRLLFKNYTRLAFINTGQHDLERYRAYARENSEKFGLCYEEIEGSRALVQKMIQGPWDDEFVVVPPGQTIRYEDFVRPPQ